MKHGDRGDKLLEIISLTDEFLELIFKLRQDLNIPENGYTDIKGINSFYNSNNSWRIKELAELTLQKLKFPKTDWFIKKIIGSILNNNNFEFLPKNNIPHSPFIEIINSSQGINGSYRDIRVYDGISGPELKNFINKNWRLVKPPKRKGSIKHIKISDSPRKVKLINEYMRKDLKELRTLFPTTLKLRREELVKQILSDKHGMKVSTDTILDTYRRTRHIKN